MGRFYWFFSFLLIVTGAIPALGNDWAICANSAATPDARIAACTTMIARGQSPAIAYTGRGNAWQQKGKLDSALADLEHVSAGLNRGFPNVCGFGRLMALIRDEGAIDAETMFSGFARARAGSGGSGSVAARGGGIL